MREGPGGMLNAIKQWLTGGSQTAIQQPECVAVLKALRNYTEESHGGSSSSSSRAGNTEPIGTPPVELPAGSPLSSEGSGAEVVRSNSGRLPSRDAEPKKSSNQQAQLFNI